MTEGLQRPDERIEPSDAVIGRWRFPPRMRAATFAVAETLFTTRAGPPPRERLEWLCDDLEHFFAQAGARSRFVYRLCLTAISVLAPWYVRRAVPFRVLDTDTRTVALERFEHSSFALALFGAKAILCIVYYEHPEAAALIGHDGECLVSLADRESRP